MSVAKHLVTQVAWGKRSDKGNVMSLFQKGDKVTFIRGKRKGETWVVEFHNYHGVGVYPLQGETQHNRPIVGMLADANDLILTERVLTVV